MPFHINLFEILGGNGRRKPVKKPKSSHNSGHTPKKKKKVIKRGK